MKVTQYTFSTIVLVLIIEMRKIRQETKKPLLSSESSGKDRHNTNDKEKYARGWI